MLRRSPGFTTMAVLALALGIGANTAIFSLIDAVLLKMLPVKNPEQLFLLAQPHRPKGDLFPYASFEWLRDRNPVFSGMLTFGGAISWNVNVAGHAELARGQVVSSSYFSVLGVDTMIGRAFTENDEKVPDGQPVAVISYGFWRRRFAREPTAVGRTIIVNGTPFIIIGVTPPEFFGTSVGEYPDVWVPITMLPQAMPGTLSSHPRIGWRIMARLKPGVTEPQAQAALSVIFQQMLTEEAGSRWTRQLQRNILEQRVELRSGSQGLSSLRQQFSKPLLVLMTIVVLVLLIACANVANLLLARASARQKEIAVRLAIGATRMRLVQQLLTESVLLAMMGGALGLLFAAWGSSLLVRLVSEGPMALSIYLSPDLRILAFTTAVSLLTGILFGVAPAFQATRVDLTPALKEKGGHSTSRKQARSLPWDKLLVVAQVALSLLLLIGAGLFVSSLQKLKSLDAGFNTDHVVLFTVDPTLRGYQGAQVTRLYKDILQQITAIPGIRSASVSRISLIGGGANTGSVSVQGYASRPNEDDTAYMNQVGPNFFETMGIPILLGRGFGPQDDESAPKVAVVNEVMARYYFPKDSPIGKRFGWGRPETSGQIEIVGLVKDAKYDNLRTSPPRTIYMPLFQAPDQRRPMTFEVRTVGNPTSMIAAVRHAIQSIDKDLLVFDVKTQAEQVNESLTQERLIATLSSFFGLLALLLACVGLYGLMSYTVLRRTNEIGIRVALGAQPGDILWLVLGETMLLILAGVAIVVPIALAATRLVSTFLFGLTPTDSTTITIATLLLIAVAALAGYLPARRASRVDPMVALRYE
jgi:predicted permease